jgi:hypothetical protein
MRGELSAAELAAEEALVRDTLGSSGGTHWREFLDAWPEH